MAIISDLSNAIDTTLVDYAQTIFNAVAEPIRDLLGALALLALMFIAINHLIQFRTINYSTYLQWGLRYILIYTFATMWTNFEGIYTILVTVPGDYAALMIKAVALRIETIDPRVLDPGRIHDTYSAMDEFGHAIVYIAGIFFKGFSILHLGRSLRDVFTGVLILSIGGIFVAASAIIVMIGKIGFAIGIGLAPLAMVMLMLEQTKQYFESWTRFTVGFVVIPLLTAALMSIVLFIAASALAQSHANEFDKASYFGFVFVMISALVLLFMIPTMASTLASSSVAAVGAGASFAAASMVKGTASSVYSGGERLRDGASAASKARSAGASPAAAAWSAISSMRQSAHIRQQRRDERLARRMIGQAPSKADGRAGDSAPESSGPRRSSNSPLSAEQNNLYR